MLRYSSGPAIARPSPRWQAQVHAHATAGMAILADLVASIGGRGDDELAWTALDTGTRTAKVALDGTPRRVAIAPNGRRVAIGGELDDDVRILEVGADGPPLALEGRRSTDALAWLDDHTLAVVDGALSVWEIGASARLRWRVGEPDDPRADLLRHLVLLDDETVGTLRVDGQGHARIDLHRRADGSLARTIAWTARLPTADLDGALVCSPARARCAWAHAYGKGEVLIVELAQGREVARLRADGVAATALAWVDEQRLVVGTADGRLRLVDATQGGELGAIRAHASAIVALALAGDDVIAAVADGTLARWPLAALTASEVAEASAPIRSVTVLDDGLLLAVDEGALARVRGGRGWTRPRPPGDLTAVAVDAAHGVAFVAATRRVGNASVAQRSACALVGLDDGRTIAELELEGAVRAVAIDETGELAVALEPNPQPAEDIRPLARLHARDPAVTLHRAWGPGLVHALVVAPAPDRFAAALNDGRIVVLGADLDAPARAWKAHGAPAVALYRIDDALVSLGLDARVVVSDPRTGTVLRELAFTRHPRKREGPIAHARVADGRTLALSFRLPHLELADLDEGRVRATVELPAPALLVAAPRDGSVVAVACEGGAVRVFDARSLAPLGEWDGGGTIRQLVWSDARTLFARNTAGQLHGFELDPSR